jgi:chromosome segregation ATPase
MEELAKIQADLEQCRRHSDNHRRSRDYHKETNAKLRKEIDVLQQSVKWWHKEHSDIETELMDCQRHHRGWIAFGIVASVYSIGMTVLFAWCLRM